MQGIYNPPFGLPRITPMGKVRERAKIRNRYNQAAHLAKDTMSEKYHFCGLKCRFLSSLALNFDT